MPDRSYPRLAMKRPGARVGLLIAVVVLLIALAALLGWAVGNQTASKTKTVTAPGQATMAVPAGHMGGANLPIAQIGDPARGARLWQSKRCSDCHSYAGRDRKSTRLNSSHVRISYAVFCLKKKKPARE